MERFRRTTYTQMSRNKRGLFFDTRAKNPDSKCMFGVHLNAGNDRNGNPRRVIVVFEIENKRAKYLATVIEGNMGAIGSMAHAGFENVPVVGTFGMTASEYRFYLKDKKAIRMW